MEFKKCFPKRVHLNWDLEEWKETYVWKTSGQAFQGITISKLLKWNLIWAIGETDRTPGCPGFSELVGETSTKLESQHGPDYAVTKAWQEVWVLL